MVFDNRCQNQSRVSPERSVMPARRSGADRADTRTGPTSPPWSALARSLEVADGEEGVEGDPLGGRYIRAATFPVDDADGVLHHCPLRTKVLGRQHDLPSRGHDVLNDEKAAARHLAAFADLLGPVFLRLLAHEVRRQPGHRRQHRRQRDAAEFEAGETLGFRRHERHQRRNDVGQEHRVRLEAVFVEVMVRLASGAQDERAGQVGGGEDAGGQRHADIVPRPGCRRG